MISVYVFTPVYRLEPQTVDALFSLEHDGPLTWHLQRDNPHGDGRDNILHQYQRGRSSFLDSGYDVFLTIESDIIPPPDTVGRLLALDADVAYGHYFFRVSPVSNIFCKYYEHKPQRNPGESISIRPGEYDKAMRQGAIDCTGAGLGVTMIKRHVVEAIPFRMEETAHCDTYFTRDVLRAGYTMRADAQLKCGHVCEDGRVIWPS